MVTLRTGTPGRGVAAARVGGLATGDSDRRRASKLGAKVKVPAFPRTKKGIGVPLASRRTRRPPSLVPLAVHRTVSSSHFSCELAEAGPRAGPCADEASVPTRPSIARVAAALGRSSRTCAQTILCTIPRERTQPSAPADPDGKTGDGASDRGVTVSESPGTLAVRDPE